MRASESHVSVDILLFQRGSDELLSQSGAVSNGTVMSPQPNHSDNNNDAKKVSKLDITPSPEPYTTPFSLIKPLCFKNCLYDARNAHITSRFV